jgi:hypothetical protein
MGKACGMHGRDEKYLQNLVRKLKGRDHLRDLGVDRRIILKWILMTWGGGGARVCVHRVRL